MVTFEFVMNRRIGDMTAGLVQASCKIATGDVIVEKLPSAGHSQTACMRERGARPLPDEGPEAVSNS
ncbi:hypothetical protein A6U97_25550 [Agrobacterium tumefaciens]|nr:hypothetical protein A6U97_25550 [Agrobacterium tumefaciens]